MECGLLKQAWLVFVILFCVVVALNISHYFILEYMLGQNCNYGPESYLNSNWASNGRLFFACDDEPVEFANVNRSSDNDLLVFLIALPLSVLGLVLAIKYIRGEPLKLLIQVK